MGRSDETPTVDIVAEADPGAAGGSEPGDFQRRHPDTAWAIVDRLAWLVVPVASVLWLSTRYRHSWYVLDEWPFINRTTASGSHWPEPVSGSWTDAFEGFHGHLHLISYVIYRAQQSTFGIEGHELVFATFCASVAALQVTMAAVLRRLGLPVLLALAASTVFTFFGAGAQDMVWQFQLNANFALALCFGAGFVALRDDRTLVAAVVIALFLVLAVGADSALAALGGAYVAALLVALWPRRLVALALVAPAVAHLAWLALGEKNDILTGGHTTDVVPVGTTLRFGFHMLLLAVGGMAGGEELVGGVVAAMVTTCIAFGVVRRRMSRRVLASLVGGVLAGFLTLAVIAKRMAYAYVPSELPGSRYVHWVAVFLAIALVPTLVAMLRPASGSRRVLFSAGVIVFLGAAFVLNLSEVRRVRAFHEGFGLELKATFRETVGALNDGCGPEGDPDPSAIPSQAIPHFEVRLVETLLADGAVGRSFGVDPSPEVRDAVCRPSASP